MAHDQPTYASVPGIRVFGMMCVKPGYSVRKQSVQPPKRYQLQKPFYRPSSISGQNSYISNSQYSGRPAYSNGGASSSSSNYQDASFQSQQPQASYQYLNRPESSHIAAAINNNNGNYRPESQAFNNFAAGGGIYGRNNERKGEQPIEAAAGAADDALTTDDVNTQPTEENLLRTTIAEQQSENTAATQSDEELKREKRSIADENNAIEWDDDTPEFPWDRVLEFHDSIVWD